MLDSNCCCCGGRDISVSLPVAPIPGGSSGLGFGGVSSAAGGGSAVGAVGVLAPSELAAGARVGVGGSDGGRGGGGSDGSRTHHSPRSSLSSGKLTCSVRLCARPSISMRKRFRCTASSAGQCRSRWAFWAVCRPAHRSQR